MGISNIWQLRRQPTRLSPIARLLWWAMAPVRLAKSLGVDILQRRFVTRPIGFVPSTTSLSDAVLAARLGLNNKLLVDGPHIAQLEKAFAQYLGLERAVSFSGGRVALNCHLKSNGYWPRR